MISCILRTLNCGWIWRKGSGKSWRPRPPLATGPTIINGGYGPGRVWGLLQGPETWHWGGGYGGFYKTHALNPEGILQFMQIKFGIDYKRAEEEYLKNRYSPEEQKFYDQQRRDQLEA